MLPKDFWKTVYITVAVIGIFFLTMLLMIANYAVV